MAYIPKSLTPEQQSQVLTVWDAHVRQNLNPDMSMSDVQALMTIRTILAEPPTERAPKAAKKTKAVKGEVK